VQTATASNAGKLAVYLASPLGFTPYGAEFAASVAEAVVDVGFVVLDPWTAPEGIALGRLLVEGADAGQLARANAAVGLANEHMIDRAAAVLACLDGTDVDSGTAAEVGYAAAKEKPVFAFRLDLRRAGDNVATLVNLQVEHFVRRNGGSVHRSLEEAVAALTRHLLFPPAPSPPPS
jgi:nucleoside 2-deoxyribosyltransferase